jgi:hypothetical protein
MDFDDNIKKSMRENLCYCFGGSVGSSGYVLSIEKQTKDHEPFCHLTIFDLQTATDSNTCEELNGKMRGVTCGFPLINVDKLRERKHPKYFDNSLDQLAYSLLIESAQARALEREYAEKKHPGQEQQLIDELRKCPIGSVHIITDAKKGKIETQKLRDITITDKMARKIVDIIPNIVTEMDAKERFSYKVHEKPYYELRPNEQSKIRYRINKFFKEFK